jgi:hypothetical protein
VRNRTSRGGGGGSPRQLQMSPAPPPPPPLPTRERSTNTTNYPNTPPTPKTHHWHCWLPNGKLKKTKKNCISILSGHSLILETPVRVVVPPYLPPPPHSPPLHPAYPPNYPLFSCTDSTWACYVYVNWLTVIFFISLCTLRDLRQQTNPSKPYAKREGWGDPPIFKCSHVPIKTQS